MAKEHAAFRKDNRLKQADITRQNQEPQTKAFTNVMTCAQCMMGKEENGKQNRLHKGDKMARRTPQKGYNRLEKELSNMLNDKTNVVAVLTQRPKTKTLRDREKLP